MLTHIFILRLHFLNSCIQLENINILYNLSIHMIHYKNIYACTIISENAVVSCHTAGQPMFLETIK